MFDKVNLNNLQTISPERTQIGQKDADNKTFKNIFLDTLNKVSKAENEANKEQKMLIEGNTNDLHNVMIAAQKATITIETAVQIQQKAIDTYNEVMRMQI